MSLDLGAEKVRKKIRTILNGAKWGAERVIIADEEERVELPGDEIRKKVAVSLFPAFQEGTSEFDKLDKLREALNGAAVGSGSGANNSIEESKDKGFGK